MDCNEKPRINTRLYGAMGEDVPTAIVGGGRRSIAVWVCVSSNVQGSIGEWV